MLMPNDDKVVNNVDISVGVLSLLCVTRQRGHIFVNFYVFIFVNTNAKIKVCFPYSHNNPFPGKRMGRHIKLYMLGYALGLYEWVLSYGLGYRLGCRLGYEWMMEDHKENNKRSNTSNN